MPHRVAPHCVGGTDPALVVPFVAKIAGPSTRDSSEWGSRRGVGIREEDLKISNSCCRFVKKQRATQQPDALTSLFDENKNRVLGYYCCR